jgi:hypothetical protein
VPGTADRDLQDTKGETCCYIYFILIPATYTKVEVDTANKYIWEYTRQFPGTSESGETNRDRDTDGRTLVQGVWPRLMWTALTAV